MNFVIRATPESIDRLRAALDPNQLRMAKNSIVAKTTAKITTQLKKKIRERLFIKPKFLGRVVAARVDRGDNPVGTITVKNKRIPLIAFRAREGGGGVTVKLGEGIPDVELRHAFITTVTSPAQDAEGAAGHKGIFLRTRHLPSEGDNDNQKEGRISKKGIAYTTKLSLTPAGFAGHLSIAEEKGPSLLKLLDVGGIIAGIEFDVPGELERQALSQLDRFVKHEPIDDGSAELAKADAEP
jgi:hypothetical protein